MKKPIFSTDISITRHHYDLYGEELVCDLTYKNYRLFGVKIWHKMVSEYLLGTFDEVYPEYASPWVSRAPKMSNAQIKRKRLQDANNAQNVPIDDTN